MANPAVSIPNVFTLVVKARNQNMDPRATWRNSFDIFSTAGLGPGSQIIGSIITTLTNLLLNQGQIFEWLLYNWSRGTHPFPGTLPIWTEVPPAPIQGNRNVAYPLPVGSMPYPGDVVVEVVKRIVGAKAQGRNFLRAAVTTGDVDASEGSPDLGFTGVGLTPALIVAEFQNNLGNFIGAGKDPGLVTVHYSKKQNSIPYLTPVLQFSVERATTNKQSRKNKK